MTPQTPPAVVDGAAVTGLGLEYPPMMQQPSELAVVIATVEQNLGRAPRSVLEIGCWVGGTIARFRARWPLAAMIGVDVVQPPEIEGVHYVIGPSQSKAIQAQVIELWPEPFDFVHIDGDHTLEAVTEDYRWARDDLQARMIALHDVAPWSPDLGEGNQMEVWKLWHEIKLSGTPALEIRHNTEGLFGYGLVMARG